MCPKKSLKCSRCKKSGHIADNCIVSNLFKDDVVDLPEQDEEEEADDENSDLSDSGDKDSESEKEVNIQ